MVGAREWTFPYMTRISEMLRVRIVGQYGYARNLGSTPDALRSILSKFKHVRMGGTYIHCDTQKLRLTSSNINRFFKNIFLTA